MIQILDDILRLLSPTISFISASSTQALHMNISKARIKRAKALGYFVLLRNMMFLVFSAVFFYIERDNINLIYFITGGCFDLYLLLSLFIVFKLFEGLNHVRHPR